MIELVYNVDEQDIKKSARNLQTFINQRNAKRAVEINLKELNEEDLEEMEKVTAKELTQWLQESASRAAPQKDLIRPIRSITNLRDEMGANP